MIRLADVTKVHGHGPIEVQALRGVTCEIPDGAFTFVLGPSGSGKSTLLYLIGSLDDPTSGDIEVDGQRLRTMSSRQRDAYRRHHVGFIFQSFNLLANLDAVDNVLVPFIPQGVTAELRQQAVDLLVRVGLGDRLHHRPNELSGGEQQRVAIARAVLKKPRLVLADEPTGELDSQQGARIMQDLRALRAELGSTVIVVTHDPSYIAEGDFVLRLHDGRVMNLETVGATREGSTQG